MELLALGEVISWPTPIFTAFSWTFAVKIWSQDKNGCCLKQKTTISQKFPHNFILSPKKAFIAKLSCVLVKMLRFQCYEWAHKSLSQPYRGDQWLSVTKGPKEMQKKGLSSYSSEQLTSSALWLSECSERGSHRYASSSIVSIQTGTVQSKWDFALTSVLNSTEMDIPHWRLILW